MTRTEKKELINELAKSFQMANGIVFCDYKGMTHKQIEELRKLSKTKSIQVKVVKNTLAMIAMENAGKSGAKLKDTNLLVWGEDIVELAKTVTEFAKTSGTDKFVVKGGYFEGGVVETKQVEAYSKLASREEFLGMLLSTWTAPIRNTLYVWTGVQRQWVTALSEIQKQKSA